MGQAALLLQSGSKSVRTTHMIGHKAHSLAPRKQLLVGEKAQVSHQKATWPPGFSLCVRLCVRCALSAAHCSKLLQVRAPTHPRSFLSLSPFCLFPPASKTHLETTAHSFLSTATPCIAPSPRWPILISNVPLFYVLSHFPSIPLVWLFHA